jgi:S1-C subfamily serine protease
MVQDRKVSHEDQKIMKRILCGYWLVFGAFLATITLPAHSEPIKRHEYKASVAAIFAKNRRFDGTVDATDGTGYVISKKGDILTAMHVVGDRELYEDIHLEVFFQQQTGKFDWETIGPFTAKIRSVLPEYDLALLTLDDVSYASTLPVFGFEFEPDLSDEVELVGYAFYLQGAPGGMIGPPSSVFGRVSRNTSPFPPLFEASYQNFNPGNSGGPIFESSNKIMAMWHGNIVSFRPKSEEPPRRVVGTALVIPMSNKVQEWLLENKVTPQLVAAERATQGTNSGQTLQVAYVPTMELQKARPNDSNSLQFFATAPGGMEIVEAKLVRDERSVLCEAMKCTISIVTKALKNLDVRGGVVALVNDRVDPSTRVQLRIQPKPSLPNIEVRYLSADLLFEKQSGSKPWQIKTDSDGVIVAAANVSDNPAFELSRIAEIDNNSVIAKSVWSRWLAQRRLLKKRILFEGNSSSEEVDQIAVLEIDDIQSISGATPMELQRLNELLTAVTNGRDQTDVRFSGSLIFNENAIPESAMAADPKLLVPEKIF